MNLFPFLKKKKPKEPEHAVIVQFEYGSTDLSRMFDCEHELEAAIVDAGAGMFDGNVIAVDGSDGEFFMYGPDADRLFQVIRPILEATDFTRKSKVILQYGPPEPGVKEVTIELGSLKLIPKA